MVTFKEILDVALSWPSVAIVALVLLLTPIKQLIQRLIEGKEGEAKVGPIEIKLGKVAEEGERAVSDLRRINYIMAESRRLELEITLGMTKVYESLGMNVLSDVQADEMQTHIKKLKSFTKESTSE